MDVGMAPKRRCQKTKKGTGDTLDLCQEILPFNDGVGRMEVKLLDPVVVAR